MTDDERREKELARTFANRAAPPCPGEDALVAFYRGRLSEDESESVREHLAACSACVMLARDAHAFLEAMEEPAAGADRRGAFRWLALAAVLAALAAGAVWIARRAPSVPVPISEPSTGPSVARAENPWEDLSVAAAPFPAAAEDELVFRSDEAGDAAFTSAMAPYRQGDYAAAEVALERFLASHPGEGRALFYRGVSLLLLGRAEAAIPPLASAASASPAPEDARWYLALARLKSGDRGGALRDLDMVADAPGARRQEAATLAKEVRDALDDRGR